MDNRRKTVVINKKFQYQYALLTVAVTVLLVNLFLIIRMVMPGEEQLALTVTSALVIAAIEITLVAGVWYGSLKSTHKIAGPVYVFAREVEKLCRGDLTARIQLRDKDMFQDTAEGLNTSFAQMSKRLTTIMAISKRLSALQLQDEKAEALVLSLQQELSTIITHESE